MKHAETEITAAEQQAWQAGLEAGREQGRRAPCVDDHQISDVTRQLIKRDQAGRKKYGTSLDRTDLTLTDWLQHMAEELLDAAGYALAAKRTALAQQPAAVDGATRRDAERYRFLRDNNGVRNHHGVEVYIDGEAHAPGHLDAQVDAALAAKQEGET